MAPRRRPRTAPRTLDVLRPVERSRRRVSSGPLVPLGVVRLAMRLVRILGLKHVDRW